MSCYNTPESWKTDYVKTVSFLGYSYISIMTEVGTQTPQLSPTRLQQTW